MMKARLKMSSATGKKSDSSGKLFPKSLSFASSSWGPLRLLLVIILLAVYLPLVTFFFEKSEIPGYVQRYWLLPFLVLVWVLYSAARYIQHAYGLKQFGQAMSYVLSAFSGMGLENLMVQDGQKKIPPNDENLIDLIGGPGYLILQPGNVAVLENAGGFPRVVGPGRHFISRLETLKEVASLEEREVKVEKMTATTKDGIVVEARDIRYRYRIPGGDSGKTDGAHGRMFSYSEDGVLNMTYHRNVNAMGVTTWHFNVNSQVDTAITDYIQSHFVDYLTAPAAPKPDEKKVESPRTEQEAKSGPRSENVPDPRTELNQLLRTGGLRGNLRSRGAELVWIDFGHFVMPERAVAEQRVSTWQAEWESDASKLRAAGEARRMIAQELRRIQAQSVQLKSLEDALQEVGPQAGSHDAVTRRLILTRIAGVLDGMREQVRFDKDE